MRYLLDTNVISEAIRPRPNRSVLSWLTQHAPSSGISVITMGEIWKGIESLPEGRRREAYEDWFRSQEEEFADRVVPLEFDVMKTWGIYAAEQAREGRRLLSFDSLIAATALHHGMTVVTRNEEDFPGVPVENPWEWGK
ncbi:MAG: type II toxin-antitoxin system VapC family toxin [Verrucomicrobiales bacterium]|nr:type II toxin-antitoxin system VapC family toxin [Verrucomicrobiales bacterium]